MFAVASWTGDVGAWCSCWIASESSRSTTGCRGRGPPLRRSSGSLPLGSATIPTAEPLPSELFHSVTRRIAIWIGCAVALLLSKGASVAGEQKAIRGGRSSCRRIGGPGTRRSNRVGRRRGMQLAPMFAKAPPLGQRRPLCRMEPRNRAFANFLTSSARRDATLLRADYPRPQDRLTPEHRGRRDELHLRKEAAARLGSLDATAQRQTCSTRPVRTQLLHLTVRDTALCAADGASGSAGPTSTFG